MTKSLKKNRTMWLLAVCMLSPVALLIFVIGSKVWAAHTEAMKNANTPKLCKEMHRAGGFSRASKTMAEMSAIVAWAREVSIYGKDYNFWTNANKKVLTCRKMRGTTLYNCIAFASPCKILHEQASDIQTAKLTPANP